MADLSVYNAKRDFKRTTEPRGQPAQRARQGLHYVIQKHDATRLHYDFRLEIGGALASWAIPKGPSLDPGEKRLAVRTEDHPMAYGGFEGTIPKGQYGGGTVLLWDQGTWEPEGDPAAGLKQGSLHFELKGKRLHGTFVLTRMRGRRDGDAKHENWLLIKRHDEAARPGSGSAVVDEHTSSVASRRVLKAIAAEDKQWTSKRAPAKPKTAVQPAQKIDPASLPGARKAAIRRKLSPQLATLSEDPPGDAGWLSEIKFDGYRIMARVVDGAVTLYSRNGLDWSSRLPRLRRAIESFKLDNAWLDGELVALNEAGHSDFGALAKALSEERTDRLSYYLFDLPHLGDYDLSACRLDDRKAVLKGLLSKPPPAIRYSDHIDGVPERIRRQACAMRLEGIICKRADAPYRTARTRTWLKLKCIQREEFVILGFTDPAGSRAGFGALHMGYYDEAGTLHYAGGVGTGFDNKLLASLRKKLDGITRRIPPGLVVHGVEPPRGLHWVSPTLVAELQYLDWTPDKMLRHAVFMGLREDKPGTEVVRQPPGEAGKTTQRATVGTIVAAAPLKKKKATAKKGAATTSALPTFIDHRDKGSTVKLTHPERLLWQDPPVTKADLAAYWEAFGPVALPHIAARPLALVRCPDGSGGECFFQKKKSPGFPAAIRDVKVGKDLALAIDDSDGLRALAQMSAIELHPWGATLDAAETPDRMIFDLDPDEGLPFQKVIDAALQVRDLLQAAGLSTFCKTTGGKGLHVVAPLRPERQWPQVKAFTKAVADRLAGSEPKKFTAELAKQARKGRIFIDYLRNGRGATAVAPFSPRVRPGATVSMPLKWNEVKAGLDPKAFTVQTAAKHYRGRTPAWSDYFEVDQVIADKVLRLFGIK